MILFINTLLTTVYLYEEEIFLHKIQILQKLNTYHALLVFFGIKTFKKVENIN
jgi:hypothetical protein